MSDDDLPQAPKRPPAGPGGESDRKQRLAAALRANLRRRKLQQRARQGAASPAASPAGSPGRPDREEPGGG